MALSVAFGLLFQIFRALYSRMVISLVRLMIIKIRLLKVLNLIAVVKIFSKIVIVVDLNIFVCYFIAKRKVFLIKIIT